MKGALITGTILSLAVTAAWAWSAALTIGPAAPLHLDWRHHPAAAYLTLAAAPTGNGLELSAVVALIFAACFLTAALRRRTRMLNRTSPGPAANPPKEEPPGRGPEQAPRKGRPVMSPSYQHLLVTATTHPAWAFGFGALIGVLLLILRAAGRRT